MVNVNHRGAAFDGAVRHVPGSNPGALRARRPVGAMCGKGKISLIAC